MCCARATDIPPSSDPPIDPVVDPAASSRAEHLAARYRDIQGQLTRRRGLIKRLLPRTLFGRALMIIVTPVVLVQMIATAVFYNRHWDTIAERLSKSVAGEIALIIGELEHDPSASNQRRLFDLTTTTTAMLISFEPGASLNPKPARDWWDPYLRRWLHRSLAEQIAYPFRVDPWYRKDWVEIGVQLNGGVLKVVAPLRRFYSSTSYVFIIWMVGSSILLFSIAIIFMRNQIRPIRRLASAAEAFGKGRELQQPFKPEGAEEVRQAGIAFLVMRDRLTRQIEQRTAMLAGVSHDLRTPLTRMKLQIEMMGDSEDNRDLQQDIGEMEEMITGYLAFARGEGGEEAVPVDISAMLQELAQQNSRHSEPIGQDIQPDIILPARPMALKRALTNLITNAGRYAPHCWVSLKRETVGPPQHDRIAIIIDDDGPGIPISSREDVFKPFMRLDPSRNQATGGIGLGLTITRDIIRRHGGDVLLDDSPHGGLRVVVYLPT